MRLGFLALDRPDIQYAAKEAARGMATPMVRHQLILKRCARYLVGASALRWEWRFQLWPGHVVVRSDTDWAGCPLTRRSTSGVTVHWGSHLWHTSSTTQVLVSLSSGEAETYGLTKACSRALGFKNLARDLGFGSVSLEVCCDSSAAIGVAERRGAGKIRHLEAGCLWIQQALKSRSIDRLTKIPGPRNTSDICTKGVPAPVLAKHLAAMSLSISFARARELPQSVAVEASST